MPTVYKTLGQVSPAATTETDLYTVPAATAAVASSVIVYASNTNLSFSLYGSEIS